jgi:thiosulfate dehydrogenase (quinone) large subunit
VSAQEGIDDQEDTMTITTQPTVTSSTATKPTVTQPTTTQSNRATEHPVLRTHALNDATTSKATHHSAYSFVLAATRVALGWIFLWAFLDKMFGLGHDTVSKGAWINGGSPTEGFLGHATAGPFASIYQNIAGAAWADWLFMAGLLGIGAALILGVAMRFTAAAGATLLVLMWSAVLPPDNNPFMDDHLIYALVLVVLALAGADKAFGLGRAWARLPLVKRYGLLK